MARKNRKASFGPGFLVTAAFIGPGTVTTIILQGMTGRLSLGSGLDLAQSLREQSENRWTRILFIILTLSSITLGCAAYEAGNIIGGSLGLELITPVSQKIWVIVIALAAMFVLGSKKYHLVEKVLIFLVFIMSLSFITTLILLKPDISAILKGFIPTFPKNSLFIMLALIGTTVVPYNLFLHSSAVKEKWKTNTKEHLKDVNRDLLLAVCLGGFISISIVVTSAVAFHAQGIPLESGFQMAQQLKPLFGNFTNIMFGIGFFAAGISSAITAPYAAAFASSGILNWKGGKNSKGFKAVWMGVLLAGTGVALLNLKPLTVIVFAQIANGIILPVAAIFLLVVLNNRRQMGKLANTRLQNIIGGIIILIVSSLGIWNIFKLFLK